MGSRELNVCDADRPRNDGVSASLLPLHQRGTGASRQILLKEPGVLGEGINQQGYLETR